MTALIRLSGVTALFAPVCPAGCYQTDSPDFSVSFGTYTLMDYTTGLVVAQVRTPDADVDVG